MVDIFLFFLSKNPASLIKALSLHLFQPPTLFAMKLCHKIILLYLFSFLPLCIYAQGISFYNFTVSQGLSHNAVISVYQDYRGFLWFGTRNGLNLYNGCDFTVYKHDEYNPEGLLSNNIQGIVGNGREMIYINTRSGVSSYDIRKGKFSTVVNQPVSAIYFSQSLYFASNERIYRYEEGKTEVVYQFSESLTITQLYRQNDSILIGTEQKGLFLLKRKSGELTPLIPQIHVFDIFRDSSGSYWVTSYDGQGLFRIQGERIENFRTSSQPGSVSSNQTHKCCEDLNGDIWIGTFDGLNKYDKRSGKFTRYYKENRENGLTESSIWSLYCDQQGTIWAGTYYGGVNYFTPSQQIYRKYVASEKEGQALSAPIVGELTEDGDGNLWICTEGGGVCEYNPSTAGFKWYRHDEHRNSISHNHAKAICYDRQRNALWIGTHMGGLNRLDLNDRRFTCYRHDKRDPHSIPSDIIMDIKQYGTELLLSTYNGVVFFDPQTGKSRPLSSDESCQHRLQYTKGLLADKRDNLWIVNVGNGISRYDFKTQTLKNYGLSSSIENDISDANYSNIYQDSLQRLWICSNGYGLYLYSYDTNSFENFDTRNSGLASNVVYAIQQLSKDKYIVTTDTGYSILDYEQKRFTNYNVNEDIPLDAINENSLYRTKRGEIFIGGMDGMISFFEKDVHPRPYDYRIYPAKLLVNGKAVSVGDESGILKEDFATTRRITLGPSCRTFSVEYTTTDFLPYNKEKIVYRLKGFSEEWTSGQNKLITFSNLNPGTYTLQIKSDSELPRESSLECHLEIEILPPFYKTVWAYLFYFLSAAAIIAYLLSLYRKRIKLQTALKYEKKHAEDVENVTQAKLRFFTDISHELRTPITIIIGQVELLLQSQVAGTQLHNSILKVYKNCLQLKDLITEILDFRKLEQGHVHLKASEQNLVSFLYDHYLTFRAVAVQNKITYKFIKKEDEIPVWFDARLLWKVMNNLVSNAFKHTPSKGEIKITVYCEGDEVVVEVTDNGEGIDAESIHKIFARFYQIEQGDYRKDSGSGIGLSLTKGIVELHHGSIEVRSRQGIETTFTIRLKKGNKHFTKEEMLETPEQNQSALVEGQSESNQLLLAKALKKETITEEEAGPGLTAETETRKYSRKVLVVEDNDELRDMLASLFAAFYQVIQASDGQEGLEKARQEMPDLIISDVLMPRLSGTELCRSIKSDMETCHIPVVLLTAKATAESAIEGLNTGADDYITKPFSTEMLISRCNNLLNSRLQLQEKYSRRPQDIPVEMGNNLVDKMFVDEAVRIIRENMAEPEFNVEMLVRIMGGSRTKLFAKLKAVSGCTPNDFIQDLRLKEAALLLKDNLLLNITEVSERVGFSSPQYFRKCFKEKYHVTPLEYRKNKGASDSLQEEEN